MGAKQRDWARRERVRLMEELGGKCAHCGSTEHLEFDAITPIGDEHHRFETGRRMSVYRNLHRHGLLQILCGSCNARKADRSDAEARAMLAMELAYGAGVRCAEPGCQRMPTTTGLQYWHSREPVPCCAEHEQEWVQRRAQLAEHFGGLFGQAPAGAGD